jgi:hypothetical protein
MATNVTPPKLPLMWYLIHDNDLAQKWIDNGSKL